MTPPTPPHQPEPAGQQPAPYPQPGPQPQPYPQYGQPYPQPQAPVGGFAPVPGTPGYPPPPKKNGIRRVVIVAVILLAVVIAGAVAATILKDKDSGTSVDSSPIGSCITVDGSTTDVTTAAIDCADTSSVSYIVGAKLDSQAACEAGHYNYYVYEYGTGAADKVMCLIPNYRVGTCYEESTISIGADLKTVACSTPSSSLTARYKITERAESANVPNCTDSEKQKAFTYEVQTDPARRIGFCAEIQGDGYGWK
ncbi:hypothetical protein [Gordonia sihwensis]|uniref:LppU/SCO3897 family protein n=1 Tax=Gordonia TaxID=2053 RepID=UPI00241655E8|nr:hypothetical protein [Gordonia sihwensis]WFN91275.1 hypothetical protein P5P27_10765 [Gordonia sihwensis]